MTDHLVIGDPHALPNTNLDRFTWLGNLIVSKQPDIIVCMGDFADMQSLSSHDKGKKSSELKRYKHDIDCTKSALGKINSPIEKYNNTRSKTKKKLYRPRKVMLLGNHEFRIERGIQIHPELDGAISTDDLEYREYGWEVYPYRLVVEINGVFYSHNFPSGVKGEAISGINIAASLVTKNMVSTTVGHSHLLDWCVRPIPNRTNILGLSAGCYIDDPSSFEYAASTSYMWWSGLCYKHDVRNGEYDLETIRMNTIRKEYG